MNINPEKFNQTFQEAIKTYHLKDSINQEFITPFENEDNFEATLYKKCWIDSVQWHLEDLIRDPDIDPVEAIKYKRRIDNLNQQRTDLVEVVEDFIFDDLKNIEIKSDARTNTETPGWAIDRLSILNLKVYHWKEESERKDATEEERKSATEKYNVLLHQREDLTKAISELFTELEEGKVIAKTYKQLKMYNDPNLNPVLRAKENNNSFGNQIEKNI
ncbi:MAG: DUF4254 domain-containing protein [Bacteroidota bacterium]|nr:DUF4254 domain-containing protein [Bacteroidota bacterium]